MDGCITLCLKDVFTVHMLVHMQCRKDNAWVFLSLSISTHRIRFWKSEVHFSDSSIFPKSLMCCVHMQECETRKVCVCYRYVLDVTKREIIHVSHQISMSQTATEHFSFFKPLWCENRVQHHEVLVPWGHGRDGVGQPKVAAHFPDCSLLSEVVWQPCSTPFLRKGTNWWWKTGGQSAGSISLIPLVLSGRRSRALRAVI